MFFIITLWACAPVETVTTPFEGPGFDEEAGLPLLVQDNYILALTELHVINAPGPGSLFGDHAGRIGTYLYSGENDIPGFVGGSFRNVGQLEWWTLTVWTDEESMMEFVLSEPHVTAMADLSAVSKAARSTHVSVTPDQLPVPWDYALDQLETVDWLIGDEP